MSTTLSHAYAHKRALHHIPTLGIISWSTLVCVHLFQCSLDHTMLMKFCTNKKTYQNRWHFSASVKRNHFVVQALVDVNNALTVGLQHKNDIVKCIYNWQIQFSFFCNLHASGQVLWCKNFFVQRSWKSHECLHLERYFLCMKLWGESCYCLIEMDRKFNNSMLIL